MVGNLVKVTTAMPSSLYPLKIERPTLQAGRKYFVVIWSLLVLHRVCRMLWYYLGGDSIHSSKQFFSVEKYRIISDRVIATKLQPPASALILPFASLTPDPARAMPPLWKFLLLKRWSDHECSADAQQHVDEGFISIAAGLVALAYGQKI
ncbi:hypothetical protein PM082_014842 [Marasmius tenuissimus]|nr:hypothetical protein PM082_014842 [Marasmius tenuissimus]